jgi:hypothetical protein
LASITLVLARIALVSHSYWLALTHSYWLASALALASIGSHWLVSARLGRIGLHGFVSVVSAISRIVHTHFGRIGRIGSYPTHSHWLAFARTALVLARANSYWFALACVALVLAMIALVLRQRPFYLVQVFLRLTEPVFIERSFFFFVRGAILACNGCRFSHCAHISRKACLFLFRICTSPSDIRKRK